MINRVATSARVERAISVSCLTHDQLWLEFQLRSHTNCFFLSTCSFITTTTTTTTATTHSIITVAAMSQDLLQYATVEEITTIFDLPPPNAMLLLAKTLAVIEHGDRKPVLEAPREVRVAWVDKGLDKIVRILYLYYPT